MNAMIIYFVTLEMNEHVAILEIRHIYYYFSRHEDVHVV